jgi:hypothetical protein
MEPYKSPLSCRESRKHAFESTAYDSAVPKLKLEDTDDSPPRKQRHLDTTQSTSYIEGLDRHERVEMILRDLRDKHQWSLQDFIQSMVTTEPTNVDQQTADTWVGRLSEAIQQPEVTERLSVSQALRDVGNSDLISRLRTELQQLSTLEGGLGQFNDDTPISGIEMPTIAERVQKTAPELCRFLTSLMTPEAAHGPNSKDYSGPVTMICSTLAFMSSPLKANNLPTLLGVYLYSMRVKRRTMNVLAGLGIVPNYRTVLGRCDKQAEIGKVRLVSPYGTSKLMGE